MHAVHIIRRSHTELRSDTPTASSSFHRAPKLNRDFKVATLDSANVAWALVVASYSLKFLAYVLCNATAE